MIETTDLKEFLSYLSKRVDKELFIKIYDVWYSI